ncbi:MAG: TAXI family TRAP transporter solute-binding subunit [Anaerolineae bacterium]|nr:TAXI family TRAP transporter solute-binding subunit [Anaerolineae bacterium]
MNKKVSMMALASAMTVMAACAAPTAAPSGSTGSSGAAGSAGACSAAKATKPMPSGTARLVIGTGGTGGVFYPYGSGIARILQEKMPNTQATGEVTGGSVDNMKLLNKGDADIAMSTADSAYEASQGIGVYKDVGKVPACTIANLYVSFVHIVALEESGIGKVEDMKGKRISVGSAGSSTEVAADRVLEAAGLDGKKDIKREALSVAESVNAMKDKKLDAFFWVGGLPTAGITDLVNTPGLKVKFVDGAQYVDKIVAKYGPLYSKFSLPKGVYKGFDQDIPGMGIGNVLLVHESMNEQFAYNITKTIFENLPDVQKVHSEARSLTAQGASVGSSLPYHPGAIKYFKEKGVLK